MKIPANTMYYSRLKTYGTYDIENPDAEPEAGCPRLFKAKYNGPGIQETASVFAAYGSVVHDALFLAEEENLPLLPDALDKAWARQDDDLVLGPQYYAEAIEDLEKYLERTSDSLATVAVEQHLTMPLVEIDGVQYFGAGYIDKISVDPYDPMTIYVDDYKTNRAPVSQSEIDRWNQGTWYACLVRANADKYLPGVDPQDLTIWVAWDGIKWYRLTSPRPHWQLDQFEDWMRAITRRIVADDEAKPILNDNCDWCPIRFDCPAFQALPGEGKTLMDRMSKATTLEQRIQLMQEAEAVAKALNSGVVKPVKEEILKAVTDGEPIVIGGKKYFADEPWETVIDVGEVMSILGENTFLNMASVTQKALEEVSKGDPVLRDKLKATMTRQPKGRKSLKVAKPD